MGGASSVNRQENIKINNKLISFYNMDLPSSQQISFPVNKDTTINNLITFIKEKLGVQNVTLYYEQIRLDDLSFLLYDYLDILPNRAFGYRTNQAQQQISQQNIKIIQNDKKTSQSLVIGSNKSMVQGTSNPNQSEQKNKSSIYINQQKYSQQIMVQSQNKQEKEKPIQNSTKNEENNEKNQNLILNQLLKLAFQKSENTKIELDQLYSENNNMKQQIEELQQRNNTLEELQKSFNQNNNDDLLKLQNIKQNSQINIQLTQTIDNDKKIVKFLNQCGHYLEEQTVQKIITEALINKTMAYCNQCKPKLSSSILLKMDSFGKSYKEFQANCEINQLKIKLQQQKNYLISQCPTNSCTFFCIINKQKEIKSQYYFCPQCLNKSIKISS